MNHVQEYQKRMARYFNKKVKTRNIKEGDLVLKALRKNIMDPRGKFRPNWSGPYMIKTIPSGGAAILTDMDGNEFSKMTNMDQLKKFYP